MFIEGVLNMMFQNNQIKSLSDIKLAKMGQISKKKIPFADIYSLKPGRHKFPSRCTCTRNFVL